MRFLIGPMLNGTIVLHIISFIIIIRAGYCLVCTCKIAFWIALRLATPLFPIIGALHTALQVPATSHGDTHTSKFTNHMSNFRAAREDAGWPQKWMRRQGLWLAGSCTAPSWSKKKSAPSGLFDSQQVGYLLTDLAIKRSCYRPAPFTYTGCADSNTIRRPTVWPCHINST